VAIATIIDDRPEVGKQGFGRAGPAVDQVIAKTIQSQASPSLPWTHQPSPRGRNNEG
jgi:hypothetical protein